MILDLAKSTVFVGNSVYCKKCKDLHFEGTLYGKNLEKSDNSFCQSYKTEKGL